MTYRSSINPFDKTDYSNFAFKKAEILEILKVLNSNFSFDESEQKKVNVSHENSNQNPQYDYKFFLFKKPLLSLHEASCIMTGYSPQYINQCRNDTNFNHNFANYLGALDYIRSCTSAQILNYYEQYDEMNADEFKQFLANNDTFIDGFNDYLKVSTFSSTQENNKSDETISDLEFDLIIERATVDTLNKENTKLKAELLEKDKKIKELESIPQKDGTDLLRLIFDETATERYAPDLVLSIKLWEHTYITNPKNDSHSNKADTWLGNNTGYDTAKKQGSASKIREITTPFVNWGNLRDKNHKK